MTAPAKWWMLTIPFDKFKPELVQGVQYIKGQAEEGEGGYKHWQLVVCLERKQRLSGAKKLFCEQAHLEPTRSSAALEYVWKDETSVEGTRFELGRVPFKRNSGVDWEQQRQLAKEGRLDEIEPQIFINNYRTLKQIKTDYAGLHPREEVRTMVYWGVPNSGKTYRAKLESGYHDAEGKVLLENLKDIYVKTGSNKWWDGYAGQKKVIIEEFDGQIGINHLKVWTDPSGTPCNVETKGGSVPLLATEFWITSNKDWREWYPDACKNDRKALRRRWKIHQFVNEWRRSEVVVQDVDE